MTIQQGQYRVTYPDRQHFIEVTADDAERAIIRAAESVEAVTGHLTSEVLGWRTEVQTIKEPVTLSDEEYEDFVVRVADRVARNRELSEQLR